LLSSPVICTDLKQFRWMLSDFSDIYENFDIESSLAYFERPDDFLLEQRKTMKLPIQKGFTRYSIRKKRESDFRYSVGYGCPECRKIIIGVPTIKIGDGSMGCIPREDSTKDLIYRCSRRECGEVMLSRPIVVLGSS